MRKNKKIEMVSEMINYIGYYGSEECREKRAYVLAATNKMDYIVKALRNCGENIRIISMSPSIGCAAKGYTYERYGAEVRMLPFLNASIKILRPIGRMLNRLRLLRLLLKLNKDSSVIVYHSLGYMRTIRLAKRLKKFKLILELEEIYGDVTCNAKTVKLERDFFKKADAYIFPTELLNKEINIEDKPYVIIHGTYNVEKQIAEKSDDGCIHCVYAGTFDPRKGGVAAAAAGAFLDERYHIHILGFGRDNDKKNLLQKIDEVNALSKCRVTYDGLLSGEEYIKFIQSCDIGLSTQNPDAAFNATSFPSKVLSYMANGLRVVSIKITALETSAVNDLLYYYEENNPEAIANAIKAIDITMPYDSRERIKELDRKFTEEIKKLLEQV